MADEKPYKLEMDRKQLEDLHEILYHAAGQRSRSRSDKALRLLNPVYDLLKT